MILVGADEVSALSCLVPSAECSPGKCFETPQLLETFFLAPEVATDRDAIVTNNARSSNVVHEAGVVDLRFAAGVSSNSITGFTSCRRYTDAIVSLWLLTLADQSGASSGSYLMPAAVYLKADFDLYLDFDLISS